MRKERWSGGDAASYRMTFAFLQGSLPGCTHWGGCGCATGEDARHSVIFFELVKAAADEVHDLECVALGELCVGPAIARDDLAVEFDGDAVGLHSEFFHEGGERGSRGGSLFAVDGEGHRICNW